MIGLACERSRSNARNSNGNLRGVFAAALEILAPSKLLTNPLQRGRKVSHGELRWVDGQRVVLLEGSPQEIGQAHGELLKSEALACIDSVLYAFGTVQTIRTGRWFRHDLDAAYARLSPHIPERHKIETRSDGWSDWPRRRSCRRAQRLSGNVSLFRLRGLRQRPPQTESSITVGCWIT